MIGHIVSHYRVLQKLGGGGMGVVYRAEDLKLRRTVALKFLAPELTRDEDAKKRFLHEAQAASALDHPNICAIHEIDETSEGQLFIAMTCYDGESLKERIARRHVEVEEAFQIAFAVAQGLARAHASSIIHRDIKPGNVMITNDGFVKIIDFGLSKLIGRSRVTGSGATLGTVAYMSPEQARSEEVDARADIWALGAILYEMLTARVPFRGEIDQAVVYSILNENPVPIRELRADVPEACVAVVMKCLAKDPGARYQSAEDFCVAVFEAGKKLGWGDSFATAAVRAVSMVKGRERGRRRLKPILAVAAGVALVVAGFAWRSWRADAVYTTETRLAVLPVERMGDTPPQTMLDGMASCVANAVEAAASVHESMWTVPFYRVLADRPAARDRIADAFGVSHVVSGTVVSYQAGHRLTLELINAKTLRAERREEVDFGPADAGSLPDRIAVAVARLLEVAPGSLPDAGFAAHTDYVDAMGRLVNWRSADNAAAAERQLAALLVADSSAAVRAALGLATCRLAVVAGGEGAPDPARLAVAEGHLQRALQENPNHPNAQLWLSYVYLRAGRSDDRIRVLKEAIATHPRGIPVREELGWAYADVQRYDEAMAAFADLSRLVPDYAYAHWSLGWVCWKTERHTEEHQANERALRLAPASYRVLNSLGLYFDAAGDIARAREYYERAFLIKPDCATCLNVGRMLYLENRFKESAMYCEYALEYCDTTHYTVWTNLASALYHMEDGHERAQPLLRKGLRMVNERLALVPDDATAAALAADMYSMAGDRNAALAMAQRAAMAPDGFVQFRLAQVYENLGDRAQALHWIGGAIQNEFPLHEIVNEPMLRELVKDPRFTRMVTAANER